MNISVTVILEAREASFTMEISELDRDGKAIAECLWRHDAPEGLPPGETGVLRRLRWARRCKRIPSSVRIMRYLLL